MVEDGRRDQPNYGGLLRNDPTVANDFEFRSAFRQDHGQFTTGDFTPHAGVPRALPGINEERLRARSHLREQPDCRRI